MLDELQLTGQPPQEAVVHDGQLVGLEQGRDARRSPAVVAELDHPPRGEDQMEPDEPAAIVCRPGVILVLARRQVVLVEIDFDARPQWACYRHAYVLPVPVDVVQLLAWYVPQ